MVPVEPRSTPTRWHRHDRAARQVSAFLWGCRDMIIGRFSVECRPERVDEVVVAMAAIEVPSRELAGVVNFDVVRSLIQPTKLIAIEVFENRDALDHQNAPPEVADLIRLLESGAAAGTYEWSAGKPRRRNRCDRLNMSVHHVSGRSAWTRAHATGRDRALEAADLGQQGSGVPSPLVATPGRRGPALLLSDRGQAVVVTVPRGGNVVLSSQYQEHQFTLGRTNGRAKRIGPPLIHE